MKVVTEEKTWKRYEYDMMMKMKGEITTTEK